MKDSFYREMTDQQLQATYLTIIKNIKADPTDKSMVEELKLIKSVGEERGVILDNSTSTAIGAVQGYLEFALNDLDDDKEIERQHGGKREGAGRPSLGITKKVSITLTSDVWEEIEKEKGKLPMSAYLRDLILNRNDNK